MSMGNLTDGDAPSRKSRRPRIILIYTLVGPPVGGILTLLAIFISSAITSGLEIWLGNVRTEPVLTILSVPMMFVGFALFGYIFGGIQAFLTGAYISLVAGKDGKFGYLTATACAVLVGALTSGVLAVFYWVGVGFVPAVELAYLAFVGVISSIIVRWMKRHSFRKAVNIG